MNKKITETVKKHSLISTGETVLIALSGGADSILLAEYLISIRDDYDLTLAAAHIEHGIRGKESLADCRFVENYCNKNNIKCYTLHIDAVNEAKLAGQSVEEYSRNRRYEFFNSIPCDKIATAHNLSDNVETVLFRIARGTSIKGICGIPVKRGKIIRPLLEISGDEIRAYLKSENIAYCIDNTNSDNKYSRNHIRNNIVPMFKQLNPDFECTVMRLINSANEDEAFLDFSANLAYNEAYNADCLSVAELKKYSNSIIKRVFIKYLYRYGIFADDFHLAEMLKLIDKPAKTQIKGNAFAISDSKYFRVAFPDEKAEKQDYYVQKEVLTVSDFLNKCELYNKKFDFSCDYDKIIGNTIIRQRAEGDIIKPSGRHCTKSLKKLYNELHIPVEKRNYVPVIADDNGVLGIYGYCIDERVKIDSSTKNVLIINIRTEDKF